jgi:RNA polymerase sigma-70 factor (ECF subfamily)
MHPAATVEDAIERRRLLARALVAVSPSDRVLLLQAAQEPLTNADLGARYGISPNAATIRLSRARTRLREAWLAEAC